MICIPASPIITKNIENLVDHYFNGTRLYSWKFEQMYKVLYNKPNTDTEEELIFKCLLYIYENFVTYALKYDISNCLKLLKFTLENNKMSRLKYRRIRILESFSKGIVLKDRELINLILEQLEKLFDYILDRMFPEPTKGQAFIAQGLKGRQWIKLDKSITIINPLISQLSGE